MMCTYEKDAGEKEIMKNIQESLREVENKLYQIERNQYDPQPMEPRRSTTIRIAGMIFVEIITKVNKNEICLLKITSQKSITSIAGKLFRIPLSKIKRRN